MSPPPWKAVLAAAALLAHVHLLSSFPASVRYEGVSSVPSGSSAIPLRRSGIRPGRAPRSLCTKHKRDMLSKRLHAAPPGERRRGEGRGVITTLREGIQNKFNLPAHPLHPPPPLGRLYSERAPTCRKTQGEHRESEMERGGEGGRGLAELSNWPPTGPSCGKAHQERPDSSVLVRPL